jgi:phosphatidylserine decarboxylase
MILRSLLVVAVVLVAGLAGSILGTLVAALAGALVCAWALFVLFVLYFFRDPEPRVPSEARAIVAPAHGTVDLVEETREPEVMGGPCRRISIFLSVFDVHVQNAPAAAEIVSLRHQPGQFLNAMRTDSADYNEHVMVGLASAERPGETLAVRLIAGLIARRIVPWVAPGQKVARGQRLGLIQFGSRVDLFLPLSATVTVGVGDKVKGGETVVAQRA